jgi:hypothetical protein
MELTRDDIWFFSDERNWMSGPTYDLELKVAFIHGLPLSGAARGVILCWD